MNYIFLILSAFLIVTFTQPTPANAWFWKKKPVEKPVVPPGFTPTDHGGVLYYYNEGLFYRRYGNDFVIVRAPIGARVDRLPAGYQQVIVQNETFYFYGGVYYLLRGGGYVVTGDPNPPSKAGLAPTAVTTPPPVSSEAATTPPPVASIPPPTLPENSSLSVETDSYTIQIPNNKGGYTPVTLKKSGKGYIGPQGEYYPEFPKVAQLQVMYGHEK